MNLFKLLTNLLTWMALRTLVNRPFLVSLSRSDTCLLVRPIPGLWMLESLGLMEEVEAFRYRITAAGIRALGLTPKERDARLREVDEEDDRLVIFVHGGVS